MILLFLAGNVRVFVMMLFGFEGRNGRPTQYRSLKHEEKRIQPQMNTDRRR
jgi:hypothetical protein